MNLFICHTPLHVLISLLVAQKELPQQESTFVVVEDSAGLHEMVQSLIDASNFRLLLLPGDSHSKSQFKRLLIQRSNAKILRNSYEKSVDAVFLFHDLRAESQSLLNSASHEKSRTRFILLEDGVALYETRGLIFGGFISLLKRKIAFGMAWKHAREIGLHPGISEIRCFYPHLLRANLRDKPASVLPSPSSPFVGTALLRQVNLPVQPFVVIAVPYTLYAEQAYLTDFMLSSLAYCNEKNVLPLFKLHPRDVGGLEVLKHFVQQPLAIPQDWPLELILFSEPKAYALIGARTSALHIAKAMFPDIACAYFERDDTEDGRVWIEFLEKVGVPSLSRALCPSI